MMSILEHVVSCELAKLSINRKNGTSRLVVVVECSPHAAKLPQITRLLFVFVILVCIIFSPLNLSERFEHKNHLAWQRPFPHRLELDDKGRVCICYRRILQEILDLLIDGQQPFLTCWPSRRSHCFWCHRYALSFDDESKFLVTGVFLDLGRPGTSSWCTTSFMRSLLGHRKDK